MSTEEVGCRVIRPYGPDKAVEVGFETIVTSRQRTLLLAAPKRSLPDAIGETRVSLGGGEDLRLNYGASAMRDSGRRLLKLFPDEGALRQLSDATSMKVGKADAPTLKMTGTAAALQALDTCTTELLQSWGADPQLYLQNRMAGIIGSTAAPFTRETYPAEARAAGVSGRVVLLLHTKVDGSVARCTVVASADERLNAGSCAVAVSRVRMKPPLDAQGKPMESYGVLPVNWSNP